MKSVFVIDNYDSFTYNLVHLLKEIGVEKLEVRRNDAFDLEEIDSFDALLLSPGPGLPSEAGLMPEAVKRYAPKKKTLGVCLGQQCIGEIFGGNLENLSHVVHGKGRKIKVVSDQEPLFSDLPKEFIVGRYHSWVVSELDFPASLEVTAVDEIGKIMALRHREFPVRGVQFHPESVLTEHGASMMKNWLAIVE
jgi:anthranilate synthase component 2